MARNIPVLISGSGPVGLSLSLALSRLGIENLIIEKHPGTAIHPKARGVNVRTMELFRQWGVEDAVRQHELPDEARRLIWMEDMNSDVMAELKVEVDEGHSSPTRNCLVSQDLLEMELAKKVKSQKECDLKFNTKLIDFKECDGYVECQIQDYNTKEISTIHCQYLISCEGAHSQVREKLNIKMNGIPNMGSYISAYCETDLSQWVGDKPFIVLVFMGEKQRGKFILNVDMKQHWVIAKRVINYDEKPNKQFGLSLIKELVEDENHQAKIINVATWDMAAVNAEKYRHSRIFLCGDSAHRVPPTGGMGMNTGIGDAHNLAWKLAYVINGFADQTLLDSYQQERQPLVQFTIDWSVENANRLFQIANANEQNDQEAFHQRLKEQTRQINHLGLDIGFIYRSNAVYAHEDSSWDAYTYDKSIKIGKRLPHYILDHENKNISTLDLFEKNHVLLTGSNYQHKDLPIPTSYPLTIISLKEQPELLQQLELENHQAILVRPDGHIAAKI